MKPTVEQPVARGRSKLPKEIELLLNQMRFALNATVQKHTSLQTKSSNTFETLWESDPLPKNSRVRLECVIMGSSTDSAKYATYTGFALIHRDEGAASVLQSWPIPPFAESHAALDYNITVDSNSKIFVKVNDAGLATMNWSFWLTAWLVL